MMIHIPQSKCMTEFLKRSMKLRTYCWESRTKNTSYQHITPHGYSLLHMRARKAHPSYHHWSQFRYRPWEQQFKLWQHFPWSQSCCKPGQKLHFHLHNLCFQNSLYPHRVLKLYGDYELRKLNKQWLVPKANLSQCQNQITSQCYLNLFLKVRSSTSLDNLLGQ